MDQTEISQLLVDGGDFVSFQLSSKLCLHLKDGLAQNFVHTFMVPTQSIIKIALFFHSSLLFWTLFTYTTKCNTLYAS